MSNTLKQVARLIGALVFQIITVFIVWIGSEELVVRYHAWREKRKIKKTLKKK